MTKHKQVRRSPERRPNPIDQTTTSMRSPGPPRHIHQVPGQKFSILAVVENRRPHLNVRRLQRFNARLERHLQKIFDWQRRYKAMAERRARRLTAAIELDWRQQCERQEARSVETNDKCDDSDDDEDAAVDFLDSYFNSFEYQEDAERETQKLAREQTEWARESAPTQASIAKVSVQVRKKKETRLLITSKFQSSN